MLGFPIATIQLEILKEANRNLFLYYAGFSGQNEAFSLYKETRYPTNDAEGICN
jgi:hypothetical protein